VLFRGREKSIASYSRKDSAAEWSTPELHFALNYLRPADYYTGNPEALLAGRKRKLTAAVARREEVNKQVDLMETGVGGCLILAGSICPKTTEALHYLALLGFYYSPL